MRSILPPGRRARGTAAPATALPDGELLRLGQRDELGDVQQKSFAALEIAELLGDDQEVAPLYRESPASGIA
ncbi:hypothetical protein JCM33774_12100 [Actinophytocola sp. KF-1]